MKQTFGLLRLSLAATRSNPGLAALISVGTGSAVLVLISLLAIGEGIESMVTRNVRQDRIVVTQASGLGGEGIAKSTLVAIGQLPGVRQVGGVPLVSSSAAVALKARKHRDRIRTDVNAYGVDAAFFAVHPEIRLKAGRMFAPGTYELIVGESARKAHESLALGDAITVRGARWRIVGVFAAGGGIEETWLIGDLDTFATAFHLRGASQATLVLHSPADVDAFAPALSAFSKQELRATTESELRERQARSLQGWVVFVGYFVGAIMGAGAAIAAASASFAMVEQRRRMTATLQAIGFSPASVFCSLLLETLLLAAPGMLVGIALPWLALNGMRTSFVGIDFSLAVTPGLVVIGVGSALVIALVGGMFPALHGMRMSLARALRA
jgi:putative ABC transport system permease protein